MIFNGSNKKNSTISTAHIALIPAIVPTLQRGSAALDAPASCVSGRWSVWVGIPTQSVGTMRSDRLEGEIKKNLTGLGYDI